MRHPATAAGLACAILVASALGVWRGPSLAPDAPGAPSSADPARPDRPDSPDASGGQSGPDALDVLDVADYGLGEILEGDGPPLERFAPDAFPAAPPAVGVDDIPAPAPGGAVDFRRYPTPDEVVAFTDQLARAHPDLVEVLEIGRSWQDRPIRAIRVANEALGDPLDRRPAMVIDGQHHARELISGQVALYNLWWLVHFYGADPLVTHLVDTRVVYIIPTVNPDGAAIALADYQTIRKTANPTCCDDDGDGRYDEDPTSGYGYGTDDVTVYTFDQAWADAHPDNPFQGDWRSHLVKQPERAGRFTGALGGPRRRIASRDLDGDGRAEEDQRGGTDPNRNYDWFWEKGVTDLRSDAFRGPAPWSEPEVAAIRDFLAEIGTLATSVSYHSGIDLILYPWAYSASAELPDAPMYELLTRKGSELTEVNGFDGSIRTWIARGLYGAAGSSVDYIYGRLGAFAMAPETYGSSGVTRIERLGATGVFSAGQSTAFGFNPRQEDILASTDRWNRFSLYLLTATPNIELNGIRVDGDDVVLTVGNDGVLPVTLALELAGADGQAIALTSPTALHAGQMDFTVRRAAIAPAGNRLKISATLAIGTMPHEVESAEWTFTLLPDGGVRLDTGRIRPWVDLSVPFGGWWAGDAWNAEKYRCPPGRTCPPQIHATPPVTPNPDVPTLTPFPTATPTAAAGDPTATPSDRTPGRSFLPMLFAPEG